MRLLIYGAGVIGCLYAALFSKAGYDTTIYARGKRLEALKDSGLLFEAKGRVYRAEVTVIEKLNGHDRFDYIFLPVRENQVHTALGELRFNNSPNIVTFVNTLEPYGCWEEICGKGRIIPAFPGAGGSFAGNVLRAGLTPRIIQPTTIAEIDGRKTERLYQLVSIFKKSGIPYQIVSDMHMWQLCHLALVVPVADAYYKAKNPGEVWRESDIMTGTAMQIKNNFQTLYSLEKTLSPEKLHIFRLIPANILSKGLALIFRSSFGNMFMYQHAMKAPDEMKQLHIQFYQYIENRMGK